MPQIKIEQPEKPISKIVLAEAIVEIGKAAKALNKSGLNEDAVITLLARKTKVSRGEIGTILKGLRQLESWYCRP